VRWFIALGTPKAVRMRHIDIFGLPGSTLIYSKFSHQNKARFSETKLLNVKCVFRFSLQILSETFFIVRRTERDMIKNVYRSACDVPVILINFNED